MTDYDVIIIGAGMTGLSCASKLSGSGKRVLILEASNEVGGRVRTDKVEGYTLDRGFQVLLTAYPSIQQLCDYDDLSLHAFMSGAIIQKGNKRLSFFDPAKHPDRAMTSLVSGVGTLRDKLLLSRMRRQLQQDTIAAIFNRADESTLDQLKRWGFSEGLMESFFRPFIAGVTLDPELAGSSRFFNFVMKMFSEGTVAIPAKGMQAIPRQLAATLPEETFTFNTRVESLSQDGTVLCENGERYTAKKVVIAADGSSAAALFPTTPTPNFHSVDCLYFGSDEAPIKEAALLLNGSGDGLINNLAVMSNVCSSYAPSARHLVSISILDNQGLSSGELETRVRQQAEKWFGKSVRAWKMLRHYHLQHALPVNNPTSAGDDKSLITAGAVIVAGDHRATSSLHGACESGQAAADIILSA